MRIHPFMLVKVKSIYMIKEDLGIFFKQGANLFSELILIVS